ncbi:MAG TPA: C4-dicarboxylate ABC transporter permease, partial [Gemmatimonadetes bacterium]|nr:C4-dicarboxylate ABC transporter permease [Gemmatimonadota bacterium]
MSTPRPKVIAWTIAAVSAVAATFHLYAAGFSPFTALIQRPVHLALMATLGFLGVGVQFQQSSRGAEAVDQKIGPPRIGWLNWLLAGLSVLACLYLASESQELVRRSGNPTRLDLVAGAVTVVLVLELARRATGWGLVTVCIMALAYAFSGPYLPGFLAHRGYGITRVVEQLFLSTEGIWGVPLGVSADFVYLFVLFGVVLDT